MREELVAETGSAFLGAKADIVRDDYEQSAALAPSFFAVRVTLHAAITYIDAKGGKP